MLDFALLGPPEISLHGQPVTSFATTKTLIVLCYLATERDHPHPRETLACLFWGGLSEHRCRANLRWALHDLQKLLPGYLIVTRQSVSFNTNQPHRVDVVRFDETLGRPKVDIDDIRAASCLYRGEFLSGLHAGDTPELEQWLLQKREHYRALLLARLEKLADHHMLLGEWEQIENITRRALQAEPWHEKSHRRLMLALARQGNYHAALAQYETCYLALKEKIGVEPTTETMALYQRIQRARTVHRSHHLPTLSGDIFGRQEELHLLDNWVNDPDCQLMTLVGPGGIGKTRLAQALAARHERQFLNGICYVPLVSVTQPDRIDTAVAEALGASFAGSQPLHEGELKAILAAQELLMVLDGFEHLISGANTVVDILRGAPAVKIIVTTREKLDLQDEWVFTVEGLSTPPEKIPVDVDLASYAAVAYFVRQARKQCHDFTLEGQESAVGSLCRALGGSPLGIGLAAALLPAASCAQIADAMAQNLDVLSTTQNDIPERHRSLRAVFNHSWQLMETSEQKTFSRLSIFRGGFTMEAARHVAGADFSTLGRLVAKSLVQVILSGQDASARYEIHETLRQYAQEILASDPEMERQTRTSHNDYYVALIQQQREIWLDKEHPSVIDTATRELGNIRAMWQGIVADKDLDSVAQDIAQQTHTVPTVLSLLVGGAVLLLSSNRREEGIELLTIAVHHPATHPGDRDYALGLLAKQGITLSGDVSSEELRPIAEVARSLLARLKHIAESELGI
ncbi:MAG: hypothetical protein JXB07_16910 [Anaerolineae bacterium]|nr:hypothetical protein [Anaerolineae bacterium]